MSKYDEVYRTMVKNIIKNGEWDRDHEVRTVWDDGSKAYTKSIFGVINRYDLQAEFPIMTTRPLNLKAAVLELLWIYQQKSNDVSWLEDRGSKIWSKWKNSEGTLGTAYAYQLAKKSKYKEGDFDQVDRVLYDLKNNPTSRRIMTNMYNHEELHSMTLYPCAYSCTFNISKGKLNMILNQRSSDLLTAGNWNVSQYAILLHMFAISSGLEVGELIHVIGSCHLYDKHIELAKEQITRKPYPAPKLIINPNIKSFYDFSVDDFELENYQHGKQFKIPVAI